MARKSLAAPADLPPATPVAASAGPTESVAPDSPAQAEQHAARKPSAERAKPLAPKARSGIAKTKPVKLPVPAKPAKPPKPAPEVKPAAVAKGAGKLPRPHPKLVRDSFTMPEADFAFIARLKTTALGAGRAAKKSELLRAGLRLLATLDAQTLVRVLDDLTPVKTGRPKKGR